MTRPEGVAPGCEPMRFPSVGRSYRGVVVVWHGFSSCTQEMAVLGPPIAAAGYDVLMPVLPGHGNALTFERDGGFWLWGYLTLGISVGVLACLCCCHACPCSAKRDCLGDTCGTTDSTRTIGLYGCASSCSVLVLVSTIAVIMVVTNAGPDQCISLWPVAPTCGGYSEVKPNMPTSRTPYLQAVASINAIAALAHGEKVVLGLSGGGGMALAAGQATVPNGTRALYTRQLLLAPYIGLQSFEAILNPALSLGLGRINIHYGAACANSRRALGKAGYCNIQLRHIAAMRDVAVHTMSHLVTPPNTTVQYVGVLRDTTIMNSRTKEAFDAMAAEGVPASYCLFGGDLTYFHSPASIWNYPDQDMHWIGDLVCRLTRFVANGTYLPQQAATAEGAHLCSTPCAERTVHSCDWNCTTDSFLSCA